MNLAALSKVTTTATGLGNLLLVTPNTEGIQPQAGPVDVPFSEPLPFGSIDPPKFLFNYEGEQTVLLESDITDHYVEDNTAVNDNIAIKPELITTHGFVGELNDIAPSILKPLQFAAEKLTVIDGYVPGLSVSALLAYNTAFQLYQTAGNLLNSVVSAWDTVFGGGSQTKQQIAFAKFNGYWRNRTLFTVQTPWASFQNCAIKTLRAVQDADSKVITDFEITFKVIRFAKTITTNPFLGNLQGRAVNQASGLVNLGTSRPPAGPSLGSFNLVSGAGR
jgi:hypothetical protein